MFIVITIYLNRYVARSELYLVLSIFYKLFE